MGRNDPSIKSTPDIGNPHETFIVESDTIEWINLDRPTAGKDYENVLVLTPLRDAALHLRQYFELLSQLTYPHQSIDLAFLVGDCKDNTLSVLNQELEHVQRKSNPERFNSAIIVQKDFGDATGQSVKERHSFGAQGTRRRAIGRARNYLLYISLKPVHDWVFWRDVDIVENPNTILQDFMKHDKDVLVPSKTHKPRC